MLWILGIQIKERTPASPMKRAQAHQLFSIDLILLFILSLMTTLSCTPELPSDRLVERACRTEISALNARSPFSALEESFFRDGRSRGLLDPSLLERLDFRNLERGILQSRFMMRFAFTLPNGQRLVLVNSRKTGGLSLTQANQRRYEIECQSSWNSFSDKPIETSVELKGIDMEPWVEHMRELSRQLGEDEPSLIERYRRRRAAEREGR